MMEEQTKDLSDYLSALHRRRKGIVITAAVIFVIGAITAYLIPAIYRSTATILIEEQEIPAELVRSTVTTLAWQRVQTISQRVMTRATLFEIIEKYDLYPKERRRKTSEEVLEKMREDIKVQAISADVIDPRSGRPMPATIAFTLSYEGKSPQLTQKVTNELTSLYLNENLKSRTERATETYDFLSDEANRLSTQIADLETKIAQFKEKNVDQLPEVTNLNLSLISRTENDLADVKNQLRMLEERKFTLDSQLATLNPASPIFGETGERLPDPSSQLKILKSEYATATARYSPEHPDVTRLKRQIEGLEKQTGAVSETQLQAKELARLRGELAAAREKYAPDHPDIAQLTKQIEVLEKTVQNAPVLPETSAAAKEPDNPAYVSTKGQLDATLAQMRSLERKREELTKKLADYERRVATAPRVEREYLEMQREADTARLKYREIKAKQMEAQVGQQLEKERKGERFSLIDPPQIPEEPARPNRPAIVVLALVLGIAGGFGYLFVAEALDKSLYGARAVAMALGATPLSVIPYMDNSEDRARREKARRLARRSAIAGVVTVIVLVQFFWIPWDVLWFKGLRVLNTWVGIGG
jgi:uncharacterized protein involved in exopolysaccharide biosynthesis